MRSQAKASRPVPPGQKKTRRSRSFTNIPGWKGACRELEQDPRRGGDAFRLPRTLTAPAPGESAPHPTAELPKELQCTTGGRGAAQMAALVAAPWRGPGSSSGGGSVRGSPGRGGGREGTGQQGCSCRRAARAVQIGAPPRSIQAPADWELRELLQEPTPGLESWQPPLLLFALGPHRINNPH